MITIKLPYKSSIEFQDKLNLLRKEYSNVVRYSFNRLKEKYTEKDIRYFLNGLNNVKNLDAWTKQCGILEAKAILKRNPDNKVIFGGKTNFIKRLKNKLSKEDYQENRLLPFCIYGQKGEHGNRKFKLDIIENNQIIYKHKCKEHFILNLPSLRNNYKKDLFLLEELNEQEGLTYQVKLDNKYVYISFEEQVKQKELKEDIYLGIDLNPEYIGISIKKQEDIIYTNCFNLSGITNKIKNLGKVSNSKESIYLNNKLNHEILEISKQISKISIHHKCKFIFIEDLNFKSSESKGKVFNRLTKNLWKRNLLIDNLEKRCVLNSQKLFKINPAYSSFIGNLMYDYVDPINASIEISRRGYEIIIKKSKKFYPNIWIKDSLKHQWKEKVNELPNTWKELFEIIKNSKLRYRVSTDSVVFRKFIHNKSFITFENN